MPETPDHYELRARMLRLLAAGHRARAAALEVEAETVLMDRSLAAFTEALTEAEAREIAEHPDLAELAEQMRAFYEAEPDGKA